MNQPNRIINPNTRFTMQIVIEYDPHTGDTQMQVRNNSGVNVSMMHVACLLAQHNATLMQSLATGTTKLSPAEEKPATETPKPNGGDNNAA